MAWDVLELSELQMLLALVIALVSTLLWLRSRTEIRYLRHRMYDIASFADLDGIRRITESINRARARTLTPKAGQEKREAIQRMGPKTFYYIDENQVKDLYHQVSQELEPRRIETRKSEETKKGIAAKLGIAAPSYEKGSLEEITKTYEMEQSTAIMYNRVEQHLLEKDQIAFGLEDFEYEKSSIDELVSMCNQMRSRFNLNIPSALEESYVSDKMKEFALKDMERLSKSSGYVAILTEFMVADVTDHAYLLSFIHPLNKWLVQEDKKVTIQIICTKNYTTPSGVNTFRRGKLVKITCLGKVVSWSVENRNLEITPIAIY